MRKVPESTTRNEGRSLERYFTELTHDVFTQLEIAEPGIADYVARVLADFARADRLYRIHDLKGQRVETLVELLIEEQNPFGQARLEGHAFRRYVGDFTLFMSGLFREHVERQGTLDYYLSEGRRSYRQVAATERGEAAPVFHDLARRFELYSGALDFMRKTRFHPTAEPREVLLGFARALARHLRPDGTVH